MYHEEIGWENVVEICLHQDKEKWWAVVHMVMNLQVKLNAGNFFDSEELEAFQEGFCSMYLVSHSASCSVSQSVRI